MRLPAFLLGEEVTRPVEVTAGAPVQYELGSAHGVAIEEIGQAPGTAEPGGAGGQDGERTEAVVVAPRAQQFEDGPDETVDLPRIVGPATSSTAWRSAPGNGNLMFAATPSPVLGPDAPSDLASSRASHRRMPTVGTATHSGVIASAGGSASTSASTAASGPTRLALRR